MSPDKGPLIKQHCSGSTKMTANCNQLTVYMNITVCSVAPMRENAYSADLLDFSHLCNVLEQSQK